ncbi:MAG TPA: response regulator [Bryobacteraceae bacterium]|nr:response regulator [Bryobacteraceae bacterium]
MPKIFHILIVEDNPSDVRLLKEVFSELDSNLDIHVACDGAEALETIFGLRHNSQRLDLIFLDLNLPKVSGHDVLMKIKENPETCIIPVIVLTSSRAEADVRFAYKHHANAYLKKPNTLEGLVAAAGKIKHFWLETATLPS